MAQAIKKSERRMEFQELLSCVLTQDELLAYAKQLGKANQDLVTETTRQLSVKSEMKSRLTKLESTIAEISEKVTRGEELRTIKCVGIFDYDAGTYREVRDDTGEVIKQRDLTQDERQAVLDLK